VKRISELGATLAVTSIWCTRGVQLPIRK
jgi:hypothetical protein